MSRQDPPLILAQVPLPLPGEHIAGYLRRLVERNRLPSLRFLTRLLNITDLGPRSSEELWERLAECLGVRLDFLEPLRWKQPPDSIRGWVSFLDQDVHKTYLYLQTMRLCRLCAAESGTLLAVWSLRHITACPIHKIRLHNTCSGCGKQLRFAGAQTSWTCASCGADHRDGQHEAADEDELMISSSLISATQRAQTAIAFSEHLPHQWHGLSLQDRLTTLEYLGRLARLAAADTNPKLIKRLYSQVVVSPTATSDDHRETIRLALELLADWPNRYNDLLESVLDRNKAATVSTPLVRRFATTAGLFAIRGLKDRHGQDRTFLTEARQAFLVDKVGYRPGGRDLLRRFTPSPTVEPARNNLVMTRAARALLSKGEATLVPWVKAGFLTPIEPRPGLHAWRKDQIEAFRAVIATLPLPPTTHPRLVSATALLRKVSGSQYYSHQRLLEDIVSGFLPAFSTGSTLADTVIAQDDLEYVQSIHLLGRWIQDDRYRELQFFNKHGWRIWGPMGFYNLREAMQLVAAGELAYRNTGYLVARSWQARQFRVADLVRHIQAACGPRHFDLDDRQNPMRFEESAFG